MTKPAQYPEWASTTVIDPITGANNKVEPTEEFKLSGLLRGELLPRSFFNYQQDLTSQWIEYLDSTGVYTLTGGSVINRGNGSFQNISLTANTTLTETLTEGEVVEIKVTYNSFTLTWPASFDWGDASAPSGVSEAIVEARKIGSVVYAIVKWSKT